MYVHVHVHVHILFHTHTQAYLVRAEQFAQEGRFAKAILNCNEAIALQPNSSRAFMYRYVRTYMYMYSCA